MSFYEEISANKRTTVLLFAVFFILLFALGYVFSFVLGDALFIYIFGGFAVIYAAFSYFNSDKIVLAISRAREATKEEFPKFHNIAEEMSIASGIPKPRLYVIEDTAMNAFATGRDPKHSVICATTGLLAKMNREELQGVIAHEMSHIKNRDILVMTMAAILVGLAVLMSDFMLRMFLFGGLRGNRDSKGGAVMIIGIVVGLLLAILTPLIAQLINLSISRKREYLADASGVQMTRYPQGLASALRKISGDKEVLEAANKATAHLYIANPLKGQKLWFKSLFSTHPPIEDRIKKLEAM
ncbi:MAG: zinc metalloprotease HtpX [Candidatus Diapherotrites archaeon]